MKKFIFAITLSVLVLLCTIFLLSKGKPITNEDKYYTVPRILTYHYEENKKMCFEIFINNENNLIEYVDKNNYFLVDEKSSYPLNEVKVTKEKNCSLNDEAYYKYKISCNLLNHSNEDMILKNCSLRIKNESYILECFIGYIAIYREKYTSLEFSDLYGNYAYLNDELHMVGITVQLNPTYKELHNVCIGPAYTHLNYIEKDQLYDSERLEASLKHPIINHSSEQETFPLKAKQNYYFLPISYTELALFTEGCILLELDEKIYYIEDFTYLANDIALISYKNSKKEGKITYA